MQRFPFVLRLLFRAPYPVNHCDVCCLSQPLTADVPSLCAPDRVCRLISVDRLMAQTAPTGETCAAVLNFLGNVKYSCLRRRPALPPPPPPTPSCSLRRRPALPLPAPSCPRRRPPPGAAPAYLSPITGAGAQRGPHTASKRQP